MNGEQDEGTKAKKVKLSEIEDSGNLATKDWLAAQLAALEVRLTKQTMDSERSLRSSIDSTRNLIFGTYALILVSLFVNHLWR